MDAGHLAQPGTEAEPDRGVVVAAGQQHRDAGRGEPVQRPVEHGDRVDRRDRPVVHVTGDDHHVHLVFDRLPEQPVQERRLIGEQVLAVQGPAQVPVRGVEQSHRRSNGRDGGGG